ncbi:MAG: GntR family transcriptional regulator [Gammaproteobacteria bacterium]|nr:GntR family transcriptional regulator [Gammaproteobacteria bacterium]TVQ48778.1 MAG: GntR family transcriptional regulator [Gammaproteobacteria bacterium]
MTAVDRAYSAVRRAILDGRFAAGTRVTEHEAAALSGVSRTPVREALRRLQNEGLLEFVPNHGTVVPRWSESEIDDMFELRAMLEAYAVERATRLASSEDIAALRALAEAQIAAAQAGGEGQLQEITRLNSQFHERLQQIAASERLQRMLVALIEVPLVAQTFRKYSGEQLLRSSQHHLEIVLAMEAGDPASAASIMRAHVLGARTAFYRAMGRETASRATAL